MIRLLVTSGRGPAECRIAVLRALAALEREASEAGLALDIATSEPPDAHGPGSAILRIEGGGEQAFAANWLGSAQWVAPSPIRPHLKRKNRFIGIFSLDTPPPVAELREADVRFEAMRAGGPGGQHQNVTESAVRATHVPTGLSVVARTERSQHRNKAAALARLAALLAERCQVRRLEADQSAWAAHAQLERGWAARRL